MNSILLLFIVSQYITISYDKCYAVSKPVLVADCKEKHKTKAYTTLITKKKYSFLDNVKKICYAFNNEQKGKQANK